MNGPDCIPKVLEPRPKPNKRSLTSILCELVAVLLITAAAFRWGRTTALAERGYTACGGEYLLLLIPPMYYAGKRIVLDWIATIRGKVGSRT